MDPCVACFSEAADTTTEPDTESAGGGLASAVSDVASSAETQIWWKEWLASRTFKKGCLTWFLFRVSIHRLLFRFVFIGTPLIEGAWYPQRQLEFWLPTVWGVLQTLKWWMEVSNIRLNRGQKVCWFQTIFWNFDAPKVSGKWVRILATHIFFQMGAENRQLVPFIPHL